MSAAKIKLSINGLPAPDDLIDKDLFDIRCKVGQTYKSGLFTSKILEKTWREVTPGELYDVGLTTESVDEPLQPHDLLFLEAKVSATSKVPAFTGTQVIENLHTGEILQHTGAFYRITHIHWWLKPGDEAELHFYGEQIAAPQDGA